MWLSPHRCCPPFFMTKKRPTIPYTSVISACDKGTAPKETLQLFEKLPRPIPYTATISAGEKGQEPKEPLQLFGKRPTIIPYAAKISTSKGEKDKEPKGPRQLFEKTAEPAACNAATTS